MENGSLFLLSGKNLKRASVVASTMNASQTLNHFMRVPQKNHVLPVRRTCL